MTRTARDERAYFLRRAEEHRVRAAAAPDEARRALHDRFAALYAASAAAILVD